MLDIAQGHVRRVTTKEGVSDNSPCWSPDSAHLVFLSSRSGSSQVRGPPCSDHSLVFFIFFFFFFFSRRRSAARLTLYGA